jgi:sulfur-oxidizing protein SoxA
VPTPHHVRGRLSLENAKGGEVNVRSAIHSASAAFALAVLAFGAVFGAVQPAVAVDTPDPAAGAKAFRNYFTSKFPKLKLEDFVNGPYSLNEDMHRQWEEKEQFPPYEFSLDMGKEMFAKPFKNGKSYADCFPNQGIGIRQNYPYFDDKEGKVVTLELALNRCREANGEPPFSYVKDEMAALTAYMAFTSRGKPFDIKIPNDPRALEAYENGKRYFYTRRGQLNFSCASCHVQNPGERIRAEILAPALGILNAMPIYRSEWGGMGTISRRFITCNIQTRGVPLDPQADEYRDLEYYLSYVSNGLPISGPGARP